MESAWFEHTKITAYYLWECSGDGDALKLWYAAEDIASFFEQSKILDAQIVDGIKRMGSGSEGYIWFVRNLAYRVYLHTQNPNELDNWFLTERMLEIPAWLESITAMAAMLNKGDEDDMKHVRSDTVRSFYEEQTF